MTTKPLLLLAALTLCYCIASVHALPTRTCMCIGTTPNRIPERIIMKIEVFPISGHCRRAEIIVTRRNGSKVCVNPNAPWVTNLLTNLKNRSSPTGPPAGSTMQF